MSWRDAGQLFLLSAVWGISFVLIKVAGTVFPPLWLALLRLSFGAAFLLVVLQLSKRKLPPRRLIVPLLLVALCNNAIPFTLFAWGELTVPSNVAAIINATTTIWTMLIAFGLGESQFRMTTAVGVLMAFSGVAIALSGDFGHQALPLLGVTLIAIASLGYAVATTLAKRYLRGLDPIGLATTQLSLAGLMVLPVALLGPAPAAIEAEPLSAVITLGVVGSGLAYLLYYDLLTKVSSTQVAAVTYLLPIWGVFWGVVAGERVTWVSAAGIAVVLAGLTLLNRPVRPAVPVAAAQAEAS